MLKPKLSRIIAGTMTWGSWGKNLDSKGMVSMMETCLNEQITTFDHADIYGGHTTEEDFGRAFGQSGIERNTIQLISKCGIKYLSEKRDYNIKHYDYSAEYIIWSVENSLKNLQTDYLDVVLLHRPSPLMHTEEIAEAIDKLKHQGKIRSFGLSNFTPSQTQLIQREIAVDFNQIQFSATHHEPMTDGSLDFMQLNGITPMCWNPLGTIFREKNDQTERLNVLLNNLSSKYQVATDTILLAWIVQHPSGILPVIGTTSPQRIKNATQALTLKLDLEDWFKIWTESMGTKVP
ncbi:aldo/keto reductase [Flavobacterium amniphilum]|uniref:aldo/keto reductase n=1 Tax=Flavobacterium amniphilum TaxID=1834035 RepID=UPI00202A243C|nr:aldo/keto reductase [Flavobacterium amniphilum]MCL9805918.1 aldo/keto reductase [Flavobacterium amniphilum]